jgi:hypothetical protein
VTRRSQLSALVAVFLAGCASDSARVAQAVLQSVWAPEGTRITRQEAADIPFATIGAQVGEGNQGILVLGTLSPEQAEWYSGEFVMIRTRGGRIVRTAGMPYDLGGLDVRPPAAAAAARGETVTLSYDFPDLGVFGAIGNCSQRDAGPATIEILGVQIATRRFVEDCEIASLDWAFEAEYWKDPATNYVWRSRQYVHPRSDPVTIEVFRPELPPGG